MCGRYNVIDDDDISRLMSRLGLEAKPQERRNVAPGAYGQFVVERAGTRQLVDGMWSLLIEPKPDGREEFRPNPKFSTLNARSDRLKSSPLWRKRYARQRCVVPASAFHEWVGKQCYNVRQAGQALALGGLYETWQYGDVVVPSFTIVTLPPHPRFAHIHHKSLPLMLEPDSFDAWLDPTFTSVEAFDDLLRPVLRHALLARPIDSPKTLSPVGATEEIAADLE
ncbi:SOS response-associated peptidase [Chromobacterium haemolyticum]|uniref:SOS response-associated peptidase n=1 Tax=Chromobacterium haemolyticum TaxID=394935 RepID=UPI0024474C0E|nr:SOS response-associated peptidase family protein [Chromobacterium haemolyticum]MDH0342106.1 SOS response-associated peptidase [Chromobacterium haemolyticum]